MVRDTHYTVHMMGISWASFLQTNVEPIYLLCKCPNGFLPFFKENVWKCLCSVYGLSGLFLINLQCILVVFLLQGLFDSLEANRAMVCVNICKFPQLNQVVSDNLYFLLWQFLRWYSYCTDILQIFIWGLCATLASTFFWTGPLFWDLSFYCQIIVVFSRVCGLRLDVFLAIFFDIQDKI